MMLKNPKDFKLGAGFAVFCLFYLFVLTPMQVGRLTEEAALLPVIVCIFLLILSLLLIVSAIRKPSERKKTHISNSKRMVAIAAVALIMIIYAWLLEKTGFLLTSSLAMILLFRIFGIKNYKRITAIVFITLVCLYISFERLLYAPLPVGTVIEALLDY